jgi:arylsulfate sulfotransferase
MRSQHLRSFCRVAIGLVSLLLTAATAHAAQVISSPILTMDPKNATPLAGVVEFETDVPVQASLTISNGGESRTVTFPAATVHYLPVLGLKPDRTYNVDVELIPDGLVASLQATTGPLPADFPTIVTTVSNPALMEPGYTFINCMTRERTDPRPLYTVVVDNMGEVVWYASRCMVAVKVLPTGKILRRFTNAGVESARESDFLANDTEITLDIPAGRLHHDLQRTPHGTYISLDARSVDVPEFFTSELDPNAPKAPATLRDEAVVEFFPDGTFRKEWSVGDLVGIDRIGYGALGVATEGVDWLHTNAVAYRLEDDSFIVSVRHQDAVIKFSRETGELTWILGPHENWPVEYQPYLLNPTGSPFRWQYHEHAPMWTDAGSLVLFDNGNNRTSPFDGLTPIPAEQSFSRAVEFNINDANMHVRQLWEYGENVTEQVYSHFISDADAQPITGNVMITFGGTSYVGGVAGVDQGLGTLHTRIIEVTHDVVPVKVFELAAYDPTGGRVTAYRAERIPDLYPTQYIKNPNGVGNSLVVDKVAGLSWAASTVDVDHDAADHYRVYHSNSKAAGFSILESTAFTAEDAGGSGTVIFYKIVAGNIAGTSGDEPAP